MRRLVEVAVDRTIFTLRGWQAHKLALEAGLRPTYNGVRGAWVADTKKLPHFVAYCEYRNVALTIEDERPRDVLRESDEKVLDVDQRDIQPDLFGGGDAR